jgi:spore coat protein U-like protein
MSSVNFKRCTLGLLAAALVLPLAATAGSTTGALVVNATVLNTCAIVPGTLNFGNYDSASTTDLTASTNMVLTCTPGTAYTISMDKGLGSGATTTVRVLTNGSNTMQYKLYQDSGHAHNFGNTAGTDTLSGTSSLSGLTNNIPVYGVIPNSQLSSGSVAGLLYADTVTVTVSY